MKYPKKPEEISAFDAKTRLSELLRETEHGRSYLIRRRGKAVARLVPVEKRGDSDLKNILAAFRSIRKRVKGKGSIRSLIEEGRRA